jgi:hypothetical protein
MTVVIADDYVAGDQTSSPDVNGLSDVDGAIMTQECLVADREGGALQNAATKPNVRFAGERDVGPDCDVSHPGEKHEFLHHKARSHGTALTLKDRFEPQDPEQREHQGSSEHVEPIADRKQGLIRVLI